MLKAGQLDRRVVIQRKVTGSPQKTARGAPDAAWEELATVYAAIEPLRGREFLEAQAMQSEVAVRIRIRYREDVTAGMRVLKGSVVYAIEAVIPMVGKEQVHLMCGQGASNG